MKKILALVGFVCAATEASALVYDCTIEGRFSNGWVTERVIVGLDGENGESFVYDGVIDHRYGEPIEPNVRSNRGGDVTLTWDVEDLRGRSGRTYDLRYTGFLDTDAMTLRVTARLRETGQHERGNGSCTIAN
ncbi:hypothetical protein [Cochlodiniinecator piscidefendens]|uniref:hypothetical protein n=1 Tax=Cochlodiniinecator piscidefendens TaxID=2715756 RepID=UPI001408F92D|nr:hypothetical protein [Cochlodiniinecator piscidefendens]